MERRHLLGPILFSSLALTGCGSSPELADILATKCQVNPNAYATEQLDLIQRQQVRVSNATIEITVPGRMKIGDTEISAGTAFLVGQGFRDDGKVYGIRATLVDGNKTRLTVDHNCAQPQNP